MKRSILLSGLIGLLAMALPSGAAPIVLLDVQASTDNGSTWSDTATVTPGQALLVRVIGQIAAVGTTNGTSTSVTSLTSSDGIGSLKFNLTDSSTGAFSNMALPSQWTLGSGPSAGTLSGNVVSAIRPIGANGVFAGATAPVVIWTSNFVAGSLLTPETVSGSWTSGGSGGAKINGGTKTIVITGTTEGGADPLVGYHSLTLSTASAPEPTVLSLLGLGSMLLVRRPARRRQLV